MFDGGGKVDPVLRKVTGAMIAVMVLCVLLFGFWQYQNGGLGSALSAVGCGVVIGALFMPGPRWLKAGLQLLGILGFVGGAVMLDMSLFSTMFLATALGLVFISGWFGNDEPPSGRKGREQKRQRNESTTGTGSAGEDTAAEGA